MNRNFQENQMLGKKEDNYSFELVLAVRDNMGNPTDKRKSVASDNSSKLWNFYNNARGVYEYKELRKMARSNSKSPEALANAETARELLRLIYDEL